MTEMKGACMAEDNKLSYFVLGLGLGVAVGVLFAPQSGEETRRLLKDKADEGADYVRRRSNELRDSATDTLERGKQTLQRKKESLTAAVDAGRQAYREATTGEAD
jgi:gas vesicle protein